MTTETALAKREQTAAVAEWGPRELQLLDAFPADRFNVLVPTASIRQVNPYLVPDIEIVKLNPEDGAGDIYHSSDMKAGHYAPTARALAKIRQVAGIDEVESRRTDNGRDPDLVEWTVTVQMTLPSGKTIRANGSKRVDLKAMSFASESHKRRTREFMLENAQTKALNRAVRSVLSLHGSYPAQQLAKPFAILRYVPDMSHPEVRQRFLDLVAPASAAVYGPDNGQLAEPEIIDVTPAAEEDPAPEQATLDQATGEIVEEPDWGKGTEASGPTAGEQLLIVLRERADASQTKGAATTAQRDQLKAVLRGLGTPTVMAVLAAAWKLKSPSEVTAAQAEAILDHAEGRNDFQAQWRAAAEELASA